MLDIPQPLMEPLLIKNAAERGAIISFNTEYIDHEQDAEGVTVRFRDGRTGHVFTQRARYLLGFDGARSRIADEIGLPFEGELARAGTAYIIFNADLSRYVAHRPSILHWIFNSKAGFGEIGMGLLRAIRPWNEWIAGWGFDIANGEPDLSDDLVLDRIRTLVGDPDLEVEIVRKSLWYVNQQHATHYQVGRVLCGGDAVHRHPPSSGLGSNTSIQDAFNLAWKVAFIVKGHAGPGLLDTYTPERAPVGKQIVARANQSRKDYAGLREWFDRDSDDPVASGLAKLKEASPEGVALRERLYEALELKNTEFNAHGVELNQRYASSAVVADDEAPEEWPADPELYARPTTRPGAKLPHAWLVDDMGSRLSTLDLVGAGAFTLLTGPSGQVWVDAAQECATEWDLPLRAVVIGGPQVRDAYGEWRAVARVDAPDGLAEDGCVLVRPDGHVAWRHGCALPAEGARERLREVLASVLARKVAVR
jgi:2,4-dichlorophenol 6-monooxygenase